MNSAIIASESSKDLKLLLELAKKLNLKTKLLSKMEEEDLGLIQAIKFGKTNEFVNTDAFLNKISK